MTKESGSEIDLLSRVVDLISRHSYLYDRPNIKFLSENMWKRIPQDWLWYLKKLSNEELNLFPFHKPKAFCPETLLEFHTASSEISSCLLSSSKEVLPGALSQCASPFIEVNTPMKAKKRHEVENFTTLLLAHCKLYRINRIVDVGCGVGHLVNQLSQHCDVVGIECDERLCQRARKSCAYAKIICLNVICDGTEDNKLLEFLSGNESNRTAIVSLHGCGDLHPTLLRHFCKLDRNRVPLIFTVPCCYHKMSNLGEKVYHWTMSDKVRRKSVSCNVLSVSALRLACQKHISNWPCCNVDRQRHTKDFINRALLECLYDKRKDLRPLSCRSVNRRFGDVKGTGAELASRLGMDENNVSQIDQLYRTIYREQEPYFAYVEPFTLLQTMLQTPLELFVLLDRLFFLRECGRSAYIFSIFNPAISSRHLCIIAS